MPRPLVTLQANVSCSIMGRMLKPGDYIRLEMDKKGIEHLLEHSRGYVKVVDNPPDLRQQTIMLRWYRKIHDYFEEKGLDFIWGEDLNDGTAHFLVYNVPHRLYHEVIVPGILDFKSSERLNIKVLNYKKDEEFCMLEGMLSWSDQPTEQSTQIQ